ncbi:hypothetical protein Neosp_014212 [[Neocosmospora] mangrovei]
MDSEKQNSPVAETAEFNGENENATMLAMRLEREMTVRQAIRFWPKAIIFSFIVSLAIIMEGYDTNLMSNFYPYPSFQERFGDEVDKNGDPIISAQWQTIISNSGQAGSILGLIVNGWVTERIGYRWTMQGAMVLMIGAIFIPFFSTGLPMFVAAAINICWVIGQLISIGILNGLLSRTDEWSYRIPFALQWIWPIPIMIGTYLAPESPWWLVRHGRYQDAKQAVEKMITRQPDINFDVDAYVEMMCVTTQFEREKSAGARYFDCFRGTNLRRTEIACMAWLTQAFAGTPFMGFGVQFMIQAGLSSRHGFAMNLAQTGLGLIGCMVAMWVLTRFGRRTIYLAGLSFAVVDLVIIGSLGIPKASSGTSWAVGALMVAMVVFYQITIGPACFTIVAEMPSTQLRSKTVAFARACYNAGGFITNVLMPRMIGRNAWNWGAKGGYFWAGVAGLFLAWTYFRLPEARGLTYSELDLLFEHKTRTRGFSQEAADLLKPDLEESSGKTVE